MSRTVVSFLLMLASVLLVGAQQNSTPASSGQTQAGTAQQTAPAAQKRPNIPDTYTNLKVLPTDIKKQDLMAIMKGFCIERKIRCSQCHVATDDLSEADFPSDEKPAKLAAREFLKTLFETRAKYPNTAALVPVTK
jgi:hypothetical protein